MVSILQWYAICPALRPHLPIPVPTAVRSYQRGSEICERFAQSLHHLTAIEERELFDFGRWVLSTLDCCLSGRFHTLQASAASLPLYPSPCQQHSASRCTRPIASTSAPPCTCAPAVAAAARAPRCC